MRLAANALHRSDNALGAFLRRKKAHLRSPKAITTTAHKLARIIYSMLRYGQEYVDAGAESYEHHYRQRALHTARRRAMVVAKERPHGTRDNRGQPLPDCGKDWPRNDRGIPQLEQILHIKSG